MFSWVLYPMVSSFGTSSPPPLRQKRLVENLPSFAGDFGILLTGRALHQLHQARQSRPLAHAPRPDITAFCICPLHPLRWPESRKARLAAPLP